MGTVFLQVQQEGCSNNRVKLFLGCLGLAALGVARWVLGTGTHPSRGPSPRILTKGTRLPPEFLHNGGIRKQNERLRP